MPEAVPTGARRDGRVQLRLPVDLRTGSQVQQIDDEAYTVDLSNLGIRVCTILGLTPGETVTITTDDEKEQAIPGRVVWVGSVGTVLEGQAGVEFLKPLFRPV